jgi:hypothetical protein
MEKISELIWNDSVIIKKQEHIISVMLRHTKGIFIFVVFSVLISIILYMSTAKLVFPLLIVSSSLVVSFFYVRLFYKNTFLVLTNTKILKSVRNGIFSSHIIELPLTRVRQIRANNNGILAKIFEYWDVEIQWYEESSNMYFKAMSNNKIAMTKISSAIEQLKEN